jgi:protein required for attachment to host cells
MLDKPKATWIVVADGSRARILRQEQGEHDLRSVLDHDLMAPSRAHTSQMKSDRPGESRPGGQNGPRAMAPPTDWHRHAKHEFAREVAHVLDEAAARHDFAHLVLIAPPQALGELRACLSKTTLHTVVAQVHKDLTTLSAHELPEHLPQEH